VLLSSFSVVFPLGFVNLCDTGVVNVVPMANVVYEWVVLLCRRDWCDGSSSFCFLLGC